MHFRSIQFRATLIGFGAKSVHLTILRGLAWKKVKNKQIYKTNYGIGLGKDRKQTNIQKDKKYTNILMVMMLVMVMMVMVMMMVRMVMMVVTVIIVVMMLSAV